ncbi:ATP-binding cassette domain-containing protein [Silvibacterium dinghuense]|uniref:ATP-binding cassette domain-containing protein n=1 Tax=Silvibacterium dinghuense TaxID=1560006 RepID=A0A4Q1SCY4_9BACT|nr:ATP-binding cassette domain-containing protein [Silvibacterium dinghuense]RXS95082.1 ATP-binding cassette domain-containing protein [Silvibacterium dinghuense]GGH10422.1 amino acid ABC transporter ATP-binding protein [Silvibacterium dinghuense]
MSPVIEFRDVTLSVAQGRVLLKGVSLALEEGTTTALLGRSGCGKTTLLRTVNGMAQPSSGEVRVFGEGVASADPIALRRGIGYVIQETGLFPHFTVERNVGIVLECEGRPRTERKERSYAMLRSVGLEPEAYARRHPRQLSGGQRQRVGLARALAAEPSILLMDEPFGALDPLTRAEMQEMLRSLLRRIRKTVLLVTHDLDEALYLADRIVLLSEGQVIANLEAKDFLASQEPVVQAYVKAFRRGESSAAAGTPASGSFCEESPA